MSPLRSSFPQTRVPILVAFGALFLSFSGVFLSNAVGSELKSPQDSPSAQQPRAPQFDKSIFRNPIPSGQLTFLNKLDGMPSDKAIRDKEYRNLLKKVVPDCIFHYGWDMSLSSALDTVIKGSPQPVSIRDGRYVMVSGQSGPYLLGRGFMWIDMQEGIALGGFYFHPTNGEPTPAVNIFSAQVKESALEMSQLPPAFAQDLDQWSAELRVPPVTPRYFITGSRQKIVLQHDEDYCTPTNGTIPPPSDVCQQLNLDAADIDVNAAYYVDETNHATNATAWMLGPDQVAWIQVRNTTCSAGPNPLQCRIVMARERTRVIITRHPLPRPLL
jgi:uncharacterized protein YecT (DUF1311 family)